MQTANFLESLPTTYWLDGMRMSLPYAGAGDMGKDKGGSISLCCYFAKKSLVDNLFLSLVFVYEEVPEKTLCEAKVS